MSISNLKVLEGKLTFLTILDGTRVFWICALVRSVH